MKPLNLSSSFEPPARRPAPLRFYGTFGPSCRDEKTFCTLLEAGMTGMRLNLSHGDLDRCADWLAAFRAAQTCCGVTADLMIDLHGPELRIGTLPKPLALSRGGRVRLAAAPAPDAIPVPAAVLDALTPDQPLLLDDGQIELRAVTCIADSVCCRVIRGGRLESRKSLTLPGISLDLPLLTESDRHNLTLARTCGVTQVMMPFVQSGGDIRKLREILAESRLEDLTIFAKIENRVGLDHLDGIIRETDWLVIARGDLGNALPLWRLPAVQKAIAARCRAQNCPFMVVTQMLDSMRRHPVPTRAEVCDVYNAVCDGAAALMLTGETAAGNYPAEAMRYLVRTATAEVVTL